MRPLIRWVGGKQDEAWRICQEIQTLAPTFRPAGLIDPYCGPGGFFLPWHERFPGLPVSAGDSNDRLIRWLRVVQGELPLFLMKLGDLIRLYQAQDYLGRKALYTTLRREVNAGTGEDEVSRAVRFFALARLSFKGLWRVNRNGEMNVPCGQLRDLDLGEELLSRCVALSAALSGVALASETAQECLVRHEGSGEAHGKLVYLDPPWIEGFDSYGSEGAPTVDALAGQTQRWLAAGATMVVVSNAGPLAAWQRHLPLEGWKLFLPWPYKVSAFVWSRSKRLNKEAAGKTEILLICRKGGDNGKPDGSRA